MSATATPNSSLQDEVLFTVLKEQLCDLSRAFTLKQLVSKVGKDRFEEARYSVFDYLESACGDNLSKNEQLALLGQLVKCLTRYIGGAMALPVTTKTVFDCVHLLPHAVNLAFPGYAEAGLLRAVITPAKLPIPLRQAKVA